MNSVQIHLALTHAPVIISLIAMVVLVVALLMKNSTLITTAYIMILFAGIAALPVYFTGEGAEEAIEKLPGISEAIIEEHEDVAKFSMLSIAVAGLFALAALFSHRWQSASRVLKIAVLILSLISSELMIQTAHLGGQIRHSEIRNGLVQNNNADLPENDND